MTTTKQPTMPRSHPSAPDPAPGTGGGERYVPAYFTWIANKLSRGASQAYLASFGVGIEAWRVLVLLVDAGPVSAQHACSVIGMDKASMSRCFKRMRECNFISLALDPGDGRARIASLTAAGRAMHDRIRSVALERERAFLAVLDAAERRTLVDLLQRLHDNLPAVEAATRAHLARVQPLAAKHKTDSPAAAATTRPRRNARPDPSPFPGSSA